MVAQVRLRRRISKCNAACSLTFVEHDFVPFPFSPGNPKRRLGSCRADRPLMEITVNSNAVVLDDGETVRSLLERLALGGKFVAVERNRLVVPYQTYGDTVLKDGDVLEIVTLVGGG